MSAWDGFFNDMDNAIAQDNLRRQYESLIAGETERADKTSALYQELLDYAAENVGVRAAVANQLKNYDSASPLLTDDSLIERIKKAAVSAFRVAKLDYQAARDVGNSFRIPGREGPVATARPAAPAPVPAAVPAPVAAAPVAPVSIHNHPRHIELEQQYAASLAFRGALSEVVRQIDENHPLLKNFMLQENIRRAGVTAFTMSNKDYKAARIAGETFVLPGTPGALEKNRPPG